MYCEQTGHDAEGKRQTQRRLERLSGRRGQRAAIAAAASLTSDMGSLPWPVSMRLRVDQFARMTQTASEATYAQVEALQNATDLLRQWTDPDHVEARLAEADARATAAEAAQHAAERQRDRATKQAQTAQDALNRARADHARRVAHWIKTSPESPMNATPHSPPPTTHNGTRTRQRPGPTPPRTPLLTPPNEPRRNKPPSRLATPSLNWPCASKKRTHEQHEPNNERSILPPVAYPRPHQWMDDNPTIH